MEKFKRLLSCYLVWLNWCTARKYLLVYLIIEHAQLNWFATVSLILLHPFLSFGQGLCLHAGMLLIHKTPYQLLFFWMTSNQTVLTGLFFRHNTRLKWTKETACLGHNPWWQCPLFSRCRALISQFLPQLDIHRRDMDSPMVIQPRHKDTLQQATHPLAIQSDLSTVINAGLQSQTNISMWLYWSGGDKTFELRS